MDHATLSVCNPNPERVPGPSLLHDLVASPSGAAAIDHLAGDCQHTYSYEHLHAASDSLSQLIRSPHSVPQTEKDIIVPVLMPQCPLLYISLLAVLKAGGAFCPISIDSPHERVGFILGDVSAKIVLVTQDLAERIPSDSNVTVIIVDKLGPLPKPADIPRRWINPESLAYVMYTSGSTGTPKGVGLSHAAAAQALLAHDRHIPVFTRFLQFAAPTFDVSVFEIFFPLFRGSTLICVKRENMLDDLPAVMRRMRVDACELTPTVASSLLRKRDNAPMLQLLLTIGEMLKLPVIQEFGGDENRQSMLWAMYGPTEATIHCTLQASLSSNSSPSFIGRPLDTVSCFVIKPAGSPEESFLFHLLPVGEAGELAVGGHQLASGYINRPELTALAFIETSFGRVYRTGDRAVMTAEGTLECLGRLSDGQVKLRGQRIELGEIENAALRSPGCHGASAALLDSNLILFCAVDEDVHEKAIRGNCESWLPKFMIPSDIVLMAEFPRLSSGKIDAKRLRSEYCSRKEAERHSSENSDEAKPGDEEMEILRIIAENLGRKVNPRSGLASAGLDSLMAIKVAAGLRARGFHIGAAKLLKLVTVEDLIKNLQTESLTSGHGATNDVPSIPNEEKLLRGFGGSVERILTCTPLQSAMLAETTRNPEVYCNEMLLRVAPSVELKILYDAFWQVIQSNEALRMGFMQWEGQFVSVVFACPRNAQISIGAAENSYQFTLTNEDEFLMPFRIQITQGADNGSTRVAIYAHHAMYDGWSMDMLLTDVTRLVQGVCPPPRAQYSKVVEFYNSITESSKDASRAYWGEALLGWNRVPFPKLLGRPGADEIHVERLLVNISPAAVREMAQREEVSLQVLFQAALAIAWSGVIGETDILFGSVDSGRTIPVEGIDCVFGPCIASLPLRVDTRNMSSMIEVLRSIHTSNRSIMEHCCLPLSEIGKIAGLKPGDSLYDVLFVYQQSLWGADDTDGSIAQVTHVDRLETNLLVEFEPHTERFEVQITYHAKYVDLGFVQQFASQIRELCFSILRDPRQPLTAVQACRNVALSLSAGPPNPDDEPNDVVSMFDASAQQHPEAEAVRFVSVSKSSTVHMTTMSYSSLCKAANHTAHFIRNTGAKVGDVVALMMKKSMQLYVSILGIMKAGCAYLPILPDTPVNRTIEILKQSNTAYCLVDDAVVGLEHFPEEVTVVNINSMPLEETAVPPPRVTTDPHRLSYVIFTSGTTGVPKGVAVSQRNLASNIAYLGALYPRETTQPRLLQACSHAFDVSVFEIFYAWHTGMSLCVADNETLFGDIEHTIRMLNVTHLSLTPTVAALIDPKKVPSVEFLVTAGEPLTLSVLQKWGSLLFQGYGPSETTNICSVKRMSHGDNIEHLGWVFPNSSVFVMSPGKLDLLPRGWVGEFCFGGSQVARGYLNDEILTAQKFINHPSFGRLYRSGDVGRMLPDGSLIINGRLDDQLKLRGQRIEAKEIDSILTASSSVTAAMTILVRSGNRQSECLASFYSPSSGIGSSVPLNIPQTLHQKLYAALQVQLPRYMVPAYLIPVPHIPATSSGKVDKKHLEKWFNSFPQDYLEGASGISIEGSANVDDWSDMELMIARVVAQMCQVPSGSIGKWTPFANLGIDSISAIGLSKLISSQIGYQVSISTILRNPTVALLGRCLEAQDTMKADDASQEVQRVMEMLQKEMKSQLFEADADVETVLPCIPLQEAMLSQDHQGYYNKTLLRLKICPEAMRSHWEEVTQRHSILRTCFATTASVEYPMAQIVLRNGHLPWRTIEVGTLPLEDAIREHLDSLPNPLESLVPPWSLALIRCRGANFLSFICHHALYDGVAMETLWREIECLAHGRLLQPPVSYLPFLQQALALPIDTEVFWRKEFRGFQGCPPLSQSPRSSIGYGRNTVSVDITLSELQTRTRSLGVSLLSICQSSWAAILSVVFEQSDVTFGNVVSGRTLGVDGLERLVAPCFNTLPLRADLSTIQQNMDLMKAFQQLNVRLLPYQFTPLKLIQKVVGARRRNLFNTLLLLQQPLQDMDEDIWTLEQDLGEMDVPMTCEVVPCPSSDSIHMNLHYDTDVITDGLASMISSDFEYMMRSLASSPFEANLTSPILSSVHAQSLRNLARLQESDGDETEQSEADNEEWSELEKKIRNSYAQISGTSQTRILRHTTIFQVGLDSINAIQVASVLRADGLSVSSTDIVECSSSAKLASRIMENTQRPVQPQVHFDFSAFRKGVVDACLGKQLRSTIGVEAILPCTPVQNAMLTAFMDSADGYYLNFLSYEIRQSKGVQVAGDAWKVLQQQHPMLRTSFLPTSRSDSAFAMIRRHKSELECPVTEINGNDGEKFDVIKWQAETRMRVLEEPGVLPWRVVLIPKQDAVSMHIAIHHALYDANSLNQMLLGFRQLMHGAECKFPGIEPALAEILSRTQSEVAETQAFWHELGPNAIVNQFPIMTSLREKDGKLLVGQKTLSMTQGQVQTAARGVGVSVQAVLQAAWARLLASYLGEQSVVFGVVLSGRATDETATAPFPCLVTVPIVAEVTASNTDMMNAMMNYNAALQKHQFAPLNEVQKWLGRPGKPVFDTILAFQNLVSSESAAPELELVSDETSVEYTVSLEVEPTATGELRARISFRSDIVPAEQAELILRQFDAIFGHLLRQPREAECDLHRMHQDLFSVKPAKIPRLKSPVNFVHQFVEAWADSHPHLPALEFVASLNDTSRGPTTWSYKGLDDKGNQVAQLLSSGTNVGDLVAVHFPKCPEAYFAILGILKAGCSFVALDPNAPDARNSFILQDSKAVCLLTDESSNVFPDLDIPVITIKDDTLRSYPTERVTLGDGLPPDGTCYCLYTSGTTGTPKGCEITHKNTVQALMAFQHLFKGHWGPDSRWLQFASLHFDVSVLEQYWSWSVGITVVSAPRELILDNLVGSINKLAITHIDLTPSLARLTHPDELPNLCKGVFITGGEQLSQDILDVWGPKAVIYNAYGPTEATIGVTMYQRVPSNGRPSNIGKQFPNVGSYVLRAGTEMPVLRGGVGELCVSGRLVGKGYLHRPELTEERFPVLAQFGERVYRTGDLVRILHDGCFDFLGRADDQVKLRGQRLEIGEINHVIQTETPGIRDAVTLIMRQGSKEVLVAFLTRNDSPQSKVLTLEDSDLAARARASCHDKLPGYMVPTYFIPLTRIPLSSNNKVEAKHLKSVFSALNQGDLVKFTGRNDILPGNLGNSSTFTTIVKSLAQFCGVSERDISESTSVFDVGVDSISALQLSTLLKDGGFPLATAAAILRNPVVADLVQVISKKRDGSRQAEVGEKEMRQDLTGWKHKHCSFVCNELGVLPADIEYVAPCSPLQEGMISAAVNDERVHAEHPYFNNFDFRPNNGTSIPGVRKAWEAVVSHHSILRSKFIKTVDGYVQVSLNQTQSPWRHLSVAIDSDIQDVLHREKLNWIGSNVGHIVSPLEFIHVEGPNEAVLRLHIFHALYDGNSFELMNELACNIYRSAASPSPSGPEFVHALYRGPLRNFDSCRPFWERHLARWQSTTLPRVDSLPQKPRDMTSTTRLLGGRKLAALRHDGNVTLQTIVLSIWTIVLQAYLSRPCTIGLIVSGRALDLPRIENTMGPLFNTVPFFNQSLVGMTWQDLVRRCHLFNTDILSFQHVPLKNIQKWCSNGRPLFDNLFVFHLGKSQSDAGKLPWTISDGHLTNVDYPLAFEATWRSDGHLHILVAADQEVMNHDVLERMLDHFEEIMTTVEPTTVLATSSPGLGLPDIGIHGIEDGSHDSKSDSQPQLQRQSHFVWNRLASAIRDELCAFVNLPPEEADQNTSILDLGIDSIDAIKISARLAKKDVQLSASQIMQHRTISAMSAAADPSRVHGEGEENAARTSLIELQGRLGSYLKQKGVEMSDVELVLPPTPLQQSMIAGMMQSDFEWYFNHDVLELDETVSITRLRDAWLDVIADSPILRATFHEIDDKDLDVVYCQAIRKHPRVHVSVSRQEEKLEFSDLQDYFSTASDVARSREPMEPIEGLLQVVLLSSREKAYMVLSMAHALYDAWSLELLFNDVKAAYRGEFRTRRFSQLLESQPQLFMPCADDGFWATYLSNVCPTILAGRQTEVTVTNRHSEGVCRVETPSSTPLGNAIQFCKESSISLQTLCVSCWTVVAAHLSRSLDAVFGAVLSGRYFVGAEELMFPTMNTVAVRSILHGTASSFLQYMESNLADVRVHHQVSLREVRAAAKIGSQQLFNSLFVLQKPREPDASGSMWRSVQGFSAVEYPVCVEAEPLHELDQLCWRVACSQPEFADDDADDIAEKLNQVLQFFVGSATSELLSFREGSVSICGLPHTDVQDSGGSLDDAKHDATTHPAAEQQQGWNEASSCIRQVLSEVSGLPAESIHQSSSIYHLGLDSISAIKVSLVLGKLGMKLKPKDILQANNIAEMAERLNHGEQEEQDTISDSDYPSSLHPSISEEDLLHRCGVPRGDIEVILPATPMQVYMLTSWQKSLGSILYPTFCYEVSGDFSRTQLEMAWGRVVEMVPMLRTRLVTSGDKSMPWIQMILKSQAISTGKYAQPLHCMEISDTQGGNARTIRLSIHHALYDSFSLPAIVQLYTDELRGSDVSKDANRKTLTSGWSRFCSLPTLGARVDLRRAFWTRYLADCPNKLSTAAQPCSSPSASVAGRVSYLQKHAMVNAAALQKQAASQGIGIQSLFLAALARSLCHSKSGQQTILLGIYLANRAAENDDLPVLFPTLNLVPLRIRLGGSEELTSLAATIHQDVRIIQTDGRAQVGLWEIHEWTGLNIDTFVNFLSPADDKSGRARGYQDILVRRPHEDSPTGQTGSAKLLNEPWIEDNVVRNAYPASMDVEFSIHDTGVDVGVFGSTERLSHAESVSTVDRILQCLDDLTGANEGER